MSSNNPTDEMAMDDEQSIPCSQELFDSSPATKDQRQNDSHRSDGQQTINLSAVATPITAHTYCSAADFTPSISMDASSSMTSSPSPMVPMVMSPSPFTSNGQPQSIKSHPLSAASNGIPSSPMTQYQPQQQQQMTDYPYRYPSSSTSSSNTACSCVIR